MLKFVFSTNFGHYLFAGLWFAIAGTIPVAYYAIRFDSNVPIFGGSPFPTAAIPIFVAGFCGMLSGTTIINEAEIKSGLQAASRGFFWQRCRIFFYLPCRRF
jgi:hypothetical protein